MVHAGSLLGHLRVGMLAMMLPLLSDSCHTPVADTNTDTHRVTQLNRTAQAAAA